MTFNDYLSKAWNDHATDAKLVADRIEDGIKLLEKNEQIPAIAQLITHVLGEHLGLWNKGIELLEGLTKLPIYVKESESESAIKRSCMSLKVASGSNESLETLTLSDQVRVLAVAAAAVSAQGQTDNAQSIFHAAIDKAQLGLTKEDVANRALAITGNNLACSLEEKVSRTSAEVELMIFAAKAGRKYWEIAGSWLEVERAEYRLANTFLKVGNFSQALKHAQTCLEISQKNNALPLELFFGYEALAKIEQARGNLIGYDKAISAAQSNLVKMDDGDKGWCEPIFKKLKEGHA